MKPKILIAMILAITLCSCNRIVYRNINVKHLKIISLDSSVFDHYIWAKCHIDRNDTIIILSPKGLFEALDMECELQLEKIFSFQDWIGLRFYQDNVFIGEKLYFPKDIEVYLLHCTGDNYVDISHPVKK